VQPWGIIYDNGTVTGFLAQLSRKEIDLILGYMFLKESRLKLFDASESIMMNELVFLIPPGRKLTPFEKLLQPFDIIVWILFSITLLIGFTVICLLNFKYKSCRAFVFGDKVNHPVLNMLIAVLGSQQKILPKTNFARFILMMFLILCLVLRSIYQGSLFQFLQSDGRKKEVQTIREMIEQDFTFYSYESHADLIKYGFPEVFKRLKFTKHHMIMEQAHEETQKIALMEGLRTIKSNQKIIKNSSYILCKERFGAVNTVLYLPKNSHLTTTINKKFKMMKTAGLIDFWIKEYFDKSTKIVREKRLKKLNISELASVFYLLIIGHSLASLIFLCELLCHHFLLL
jgi:hypothetical protein